MNALLAGGEPTEIVTTVLVFGYGVTCPAGLNPGSWGDCAILEGCRSLGKWGLAGGSVSLVGVRPQVYNPASLPLLPLLPGPPRYRH